MTVLFSLDGKRTKKYEKASRMKSIHQVVYQDTWLVDAIVLLAIALMMIIINCADPSSALANMNVIMRMILMLSFIAFIHNLFKFIYRPNSTYKMICGTINFPIMIRSIQPINDATTNFPSLAVSYDVLVNRNDLLGLIAKVGEKFMLLSFLETPGSSKKVHMLMESDEFKMACDNVGIIDDYVELMVARLKKDETYSLYGEIDPHFIDDSIIAYDNIEV